MTQDYADLARLIERLHRRFLDVLGAQLRRQGVRDINSVQALLLANIGEEDVAVRDLVERGHYQSPNLSYNLKKLAELDYVEPMRSEHDRRSVSVRLTAKARKVVTMIDELEDRLAAQWGDGEADKRALSSAIRALKEIEHVWSERVRERTP